MSYFVLADGPHGKTKWCAVALAVALQQLTHVHAKPAAEYCGARHTDLLLSLPSPLAPCSYGCGSSCGCDCSCGCNKAITISHGPQLLCHGHGHGLPAPGTTSTVASRRAVARALLGCAPAHMVVAVTDRRPTSPMPAPAKSLPPPAAATPTVCTQAVYFSRPLRAPSQTAAAQTPRWCCLMAACVSSQTALCRCRCWCWHGDTAVRHLHRASPATTHHCYCWHCHCHAMPASG